MIELMADVSGRHRADFLKAGGLNLLNGREAGKDVGQGIFATGLCRDLGGVGGIGGPR